MTDRLIALIDIGKTHARLCLLEPHTSREVWSVKRVNETVHTPLGRELDIAAIDSWLIDALRSAPHKERIAVIVPVAHAAAAVLVDAGGNVLAAPDYEDPRHEDSSAAYARERDAYEHTYSPNLPLGLNLGRQLFHLEHGHAELFSKVARILLYPQYWAWRLSGVVASEITSLGCHSDLWRPREVSFSALARRRGWTRLLPPMRSAADALGPLTPSMVAATGLDPQCRVACGIHDSNYSYLDFLLGRPSEEPFTLISSGTWTVVMAHHADLTNLREHRDMLANVDAFGSPVATARFMGGREYEAIARGGEGPDIDALARVVRRRAFALPAFASGGPFCGHPGRIIDAEELTAAERAALATVYTALMCDLLIESLAAHGEILIDGPLATNPLFGSLLSACRPDSKVRLRGGTSGSARAAAYLAGVALPRAPSLQVASPLNPPGFDDYRRTWRAMLPA